MTAWRFRLERSPKEISDKLESELTSIGGFVYNTNRDQNKSMTFKIRKRILYAWYIAFQNWTVVKGELIKSDSEDSTDVNITFDQHFMIKLILFTHVILVLGFLIAMISGVNVKPSSFILAGALLVLGLVLWLAIQRKFKADVYKYKSLFTEIFEL